MSDVRESTTERSIEDRKVILLRATYDILKKCDELLYVANVLETVVDYDGTRCNGYCLMQDIKDELNIDDEE